eukprot:1195784-Prorocentrum_minimum.AAC.8
MVQTTLRPCEHESGGLARGLSRRSRVHLYRPHPRPYCPSVGGARAAGVPCKVHRAHLTGRSQPHDRSGRSVAVHHSRRSHSRTIPGSRRAQLCLPSPHDAVANTSINMRVALLKTPRSCVDKRGLGCRWSDLLMPPRQQNVPSHLF